MFEAIGAKILAWVLSSQGVITIVVTALLGFFAKKFPREKLFLIIKPFAVIIAGTINIFLLKILPKQLAVKVEEGLICSILFCCKSFFQTIEDEILKDNAIEVKNSILPKKEALTVLKATKEKAKAEKDLAEIQKKHNRSAL